MLFGDGGVVSLGDDSVTERVTLVVLVLLQSALEVGEWTAAKVIGLETSEKRRTSPFTFEILNFL